MRHERARCAALALVSMRHERALCAALVLVSIRCAPPLQNGDVVVDTRAAERLAMLCRFGHRSAAQGTFCPAADDALSGARVRRVAGEDDALTGPRAIGRPGDYVLENGEITIVIDQLRAGAGLAESGGTIVDAGDARARRDELGRVVACFGAPARRARYEALATGVAADGTAWIEARGHDVVEPSLSVTTRYALRPADRAVLISTRLHNQGDRAVQGLDLGDLVHWDAADVSASDEGHASLGATVGPYVAGVGRDVGYAFVALDQGAADGTTLSWIEGGASSCVKLASKVDILPGASAAYARALVVSPRGDSLGIATELALLAGVAPGGVELSFTDGAGAPLPPCPGVATFEPLSARGVPTGAGDPPGGGRALWLRLGAEQPQGAEIPPGRYLVRFEGDGRRALARAPIEVRAGEVTPVQLAVSDAGGTRDAGVQRCGSEAAGDAGVQRCGSEAAGDAGVQRCGSEAAGERGNEAGP